jgi:UDP-glucuronate 4-epimerase
MNTILVTGGAGFIGSRLCEKLIKAGYNVICLDNFNNNYDPVVKRQNIENLIRHCCFSLIEGDILNSSLIDTIFEKHNVEAVIHLAALAGVRGSIEAPFDYVDIDIKGTVALLEACKKHGIDRFIFASSSSVYGDATPPFKEDAPIGTQTSPYAAAKLAGELFCRTYSHLYGIKIVCLRFFTVYGPRQRPDMAIHKFMRAVNDGSVVCIFGDGTSSRDYTYVDDVVDGTMAALSLKSDFEIINLGNSNAVNILELVAAISKVLGKEAKITFQKEQLGDVSSTCADITKAANLLDYTPKTPLEEGLKKQAEMLQLLAAPK